MNTSWHLCTSWHLFTSWHTSWHFGIQTDTSWHLSTSLTFVNTDGREPSSSGAAHGWQRHTPHECIFYRQDTLATGTFWLSLCAHRPRWPPHQQNRRGVSPLQHTATHCNAQQNTAILCKTLQHAAMPRQLDWRCFLSWRVLANVWMSHATHMNESWHTYEWVMSRV